MSMRRTEMGVNESVRVVAPIGAWDEHLEGAASLAAEVVEILMDLFVPIHAFATRSELDAGCTLTVRQFLPARPSELLPGPMLVNKIGLQAVEMEERFGAIASGQSTSPSYFPGLGAAMRNRGGDSRNSWSNPVLLHCWTSRRRSMADNLILLAPGVPSEGEWARSAAEVLGDGTLVEHPDGVCQIVDSKGLEIVSWWPMGEIDATREVLELSPDWSRGTARIDVSVPFGCGDGHAIAAHVARACGGALVGRD